MKKKKVLKIALWVMLIVLVIFLVITIVKFVILRKIINLSEEYENKTNYLLITSTIQDNRIAMRKSYNKDGNYLEETRFYGKDFEATIKKYKKDDDIVTTMTRGDETRDLSDQAIEEKHSVNGSMYTMFKDNIVGKAITITITNGSCNDKDCYVIRDGESTYWVDKDTGLVLRNTDKIYVVEYNYEFDVVEDSDLVRPEV